MPRSDFMSRISNVVDNTLDGGSVDSEKEYLSKYAPNIIEWVVSPQYWGVSSTIRHTRQLQLMRDLYNLRCKNCNDQSPGAGDLFGKSRTYIESEVLLVWSDTNNDFTCPKCGGTYNGFVEDGIITPFQELSVVAGMRSGKSFLGAHLGGYSEHLARVISARGGRHALPRLLGQATGETFEISYAASTSTQANQTIYSKMRLMRNGSPWMQRAVDYVKNLEKQQIGDTGRWVYKELDNTILDGYLQLRINSLSSNSSGVAGKTRLWAGIDELARLSTTDSKTSAQELYRVLNQSLKTVRGATRRLSLPPYFGLMVNVTSPIALDDAAMLLYNKAVSGEAKRTLAWKGATWDFNPDLTREDFDEDYAKDPVGAERDFGANPPNAETPLFANPLRFWKCVDYNRAPAITFNKTHRDDTTGKKYVGAIVDKMMYNWRDPLYIFCDAGHTFDGFAMVGAHAEFVDPDHFGQNAVRFASNNQILPESGGHISELSAHPDSPMAQGLNRRGIFQRPTSQGENLGRFVTVIDFCCRIVPTKDREIYFNSLLDIIKSIQKKRKIITVAFDQWQSIHLIQGIRDLGIQSNKVKLKNEDILSFVQEVYNDKVSFLPPHPMDNVSLSETGVLQMGVEEERMAPESVGLVELLKLERSLDLKKVLAPKKGSVRGRGSDDIARCLIGVNLLIKDSVVSKLDSGRRRELVKRLNATGSNFEPKLFTPGKPRK